MYDPIGCIDDGGGVGFALGSKMETEKKAYRRDDGLFCLSQGVEMYIRGFYLPSY